MFVVCVIVSILLALMLLVSASGKLAKLPQVVQTLGQLIPITWFPWLALLEILGAVGLIVGLFVAPIGIAAAIGVICYFVGAVITHLRAGDRNLGPPVVLLVLGIAALVLRLVTR